MNTQKSTNRTNYKGAKIALLVGFIGLLIGAVVIYYIWNKPHRDIAGSDADFTISAAALLKDFETDETAANQKYLDKIITVKGIATAIETTPEGNLNIALKTESDMATVSCAMLPEEKDKAAKIQAGDEVTIKGLCTGMLMDVVLTNCSLE